MLHTSHHLPAAANIQRQKPLLHPTYHDDFFDLQAVKIFWKSGCKHFLNVYSFFQKFLLIYCTPTHHCQQWTSRPPASFSRDSNYSRQKDLKACGAKESDSLSWCSETENAHEIADLMPYDAYLSLPACDRLLISRVLVGCSAGSEKGCHGWIVSHTLCLRTAICTTSRAFAYLSLLSRETEF